MLAFSLTLMPFEPSTLSLSAVSKPSANLTAPSPVKAKSVPKAKVPSLRMNSLSELNFSAANLIAISPLAAVVILPLFNSPLTMLITRLSVVFEPAVVFTSPPLMFNWAAFRTVALSAEAVALTTEFAPTVTLA